MLRCRVKPLQHHTDRLIARWLEAETSTDPSQTSRIIRKAEKHQRKIRRWHEKLKSLNLWPPFKF